MDRNVEPRPDRGAAASGEALLRQEVAAATLMLNSLNILGYGGHVSARLPDKDLFLIQLMDMSRAEVSPESLLVCDLAGSLMRDAGERRECCFIAGILRNPATIVVGLINTRKERHGTLRFTCHAS